MYDGATENSVKKFTISIADLSTKGCVVKKESDKNVYTCYFELAFEVANLT